MAVSQGDIKMGVFIKNKEEVKENKATRMIMKLPGCKYYLVAEKWNTMPNHEEIDIVIEDENGVVVQDVVRVEPTIRRCDENKTEHDVKMTTVKVYNDEYNEDYTHIFHIHVYDDNEETTN